MTLSDFIQRHGRPHALARGDFLLRQGDLTAPFAQLQEGLMKATYVSAAGKAAIKSFFVAPTLVGSLRSAFAGELAPYSVEALVPCTLVTLPLAALRDKARRDLTLANELIDLLTQLAIKKERREHDFLIRSPAENYGQLQRDIPHLLERVTQNDIARYLGITPVALSRIRGRLARTKNVASGPPET